MTPEPAIPGNPLRSSNDEDERARSDPIRPGTFTFRTSHQERSVAMRSSSCSMVALAVGGPPQTRRSSLWIAP
ncbi:hypothetical protein SAMN04487905_105111 [Actinopolyspora xinjiangensis]|uniref:Uncharacterized protein n=1 Tax=Actinopolyspora xinjiangensis TaxID=405564 RepID=A0A1H0TJX9_9ACTN|nr:hypothetical protein SAMN04487905_105111 [Actinopolyspora xinjiangensis]